MPYFADQHERDAAVGRLYRQLAADEQELRLLHGEAEQLASELFTLAGALNSEIAHTVGIANESIMTTIAPPDRVFVDRTTLDADRLKRLTDEIRRVRERVVSAKKKLSITN